MTLHYAIRSGRVGSVLPIGRLKRNLLSFFLTSLPVGPRAARDAVYFLFEAASTGAAVSSGVGAEARSGCGVCDDARQVVVPVREDKRARRKRFRGRVDSYLATHPRPVDEVGDDVEARGAYPNVQVGVHALLRLRVDELFPHEREERVVDATGEAWAERGRRGVGCVI